MRADLTQGQAAHGDRQRLLAGISRLAGDDGRQHRQGGELGDGAFEESDHRGGEEGGGEVDLQPRQAFAHRERNGRQGAFVFADADHGLNIGAGFILHGADEGVVADDPGQAAAGVDHRQLADLLGLENVGYLLPGGHDIHPDLSRSYQST